MRIAICLLAALAGLHSVGASATGPRLSLTPLSEITLDSWALGSESAASMTGNRLVIPLGSGGIAIYDISDPTHPSLVAAIDTATLQDQAGASALAADGRLFVYLPVRHSIGVFDTQNQPPMKIGEVGTASLIYELATATFGLLAYGDNPGQGQGGLYAFDTSTSIPSVAGDYLMDLTDPGFFVSDGRTAFVARTPEGPETHARMDAVDVEDIDHPALLGSFSPEGTGNIVGIDAAGNHIAIAAYWGGVWLVDASDPGAMQLVAAYDWSDPFSYAVDVAYLPPFLLVLEGGPVSKQLETLRIGTSGELELQDALPISGFPRALAHKGNLLMVQTRSDENGDGYLDRTTIRLFESDVVIFEDGFDLAD